MGSSFSYLIQFIRFKKINSNGIDNQKITSPIAESKEPDEFFEPQLHMENMADDFMKQTAFSRTAEIYGLHDDLIADDLPLEVWNIIKYLILVFIKHDNLGFKLNK